MKRLQLFEFGDLPWWPAVLRDCVTDALAFGITRFRFYDCVAPMIAELLERSGPRAIVDLCAGGTGPWATLRRRLPDDVAITFTDRQPNARARAQIDALGDPRLRYLDRSVDATCVPRELGGVRTMFTGFHHFAPAAARLVLADAVDAGAPIAIFEFSQRSASSCVAAMLVPWLMWLTTPWIRPRSLARLVFTYVLPLAPLCNLWDGLVSNLRAYSRDELLGLARSVAPVGYQWRAGVVRGRGGPAITYLIGVPLASA